MLKNCQSLNLLDKFTIDRVSVSASFGNSFKMSFVGSFKVLLVAEAVLLVVGQSLYNYHPAAVKRQGMTLFES